MSDETVFAVASSAPLLGWLALAFAPLRRDALVAVARFWAIALAVGYVTLIAVTLATAPPGGPPPDFTTLSGLASLFSQPRATLIGWFHFLALDLWTGAWEAEDAGRRGTPHWRLLPCLFLTLMAGPAGLLLYLVLCGRAARA